MAFRPRVSVRAMLWLVLVCAALAWFIRGVMDARRAAMRAQCLGNLSQIGLALHNYHEVFGCFPPAYLADANGKPMHSWRVLILPFIEQTVLYNSYKFAEPWDGPNNRLLFDRMPAIFACPNRRGDVRFAPSRWTSYVAVMGPETVFPGPRSASLQDIADGASRTILLVEVADADLCWLEPRDLDASRLAAGVNAAIGPSLSSRDGPGAYALFGDGRGRWISNGTAAKVLEALSTRAVGEVVDLPRGAHTGR
jgi:hypothetical protein